MPEREIPSLDEILNEPAMEKRLNYLVSIAYTNYNSINTINSKIEEICQGNGYTKKEKVINWTGIGTAIGAAIVAVYAAIAHR